MSELHCHVVKDLLPSYADGLLNEETRAEVDAHLETCESCRKALEELNAPVDAPAVSGEEKEIKFLKKTRKRNLAIIIASIAGAFLLAAVVLLCVHCYTKYLSGREQPDAIARTDVTVNGNSLKIDLALSDTGLAFASVNVEEDTEGIVTVRPKIVKAGLLKNGWETTSIFHARHDITEVRLYDEVIWMKKEKIVVNSPELSARWIRIWEEWDDRDEFQRMYANSLTPGNTYDSFDSWDDAVAFIGFEPWNPLESNEELEKDGFTNGFDASLQPIKHHAEVRAHGTRTGLINYLLVRAAYADGPVRVLFNYEPYRSDLRVDPKLKPDETITLADGTEATVHYKDNYARMHFRRKKRSYEILFITDGEAGNDEDIQNTIRKVVNILNEAVR